MGLPYRTYKATGDAAAAVRDEILDGLAAAAPWLRLGRGGRAACAERHDVLDALVCALAARAVAPGAPPRPAELAGRALREGWIHVPAAGSLAGLGAA